MHRSCVRTGVARYGTPQAVSSITGRYQFSVSAESSVAETVDTKQRLDEAASLLRDAEAVLIASGAGMGVDSGLPDFRGSEGFWRAYPPLAKRGLSFQEMANPCWFRNEPKLAFGFYGHRLNLYRKVQPHQGFQILHDIAREKQNNYFIFTSNVDGQFQKALFPDDHILECHGSIHHFQCVSVCSDDIWKGDHVEIRVDEGVLEAEPSSFPKCIHCGALARPNIMMFADSGWLSHRADEQRRRYEEWVAHVRRFRARLVIIELGAGTSIPTVRWNSEQLLSITRGFSKLIRINKRESQVTDKDALAVPVGALAALTGIGNRLNLPTVK